LENLAWTWNRLLSGRANEKWKRILSFNSSTNYWFIEKVQLGDNERIVVDKLDFGKSICLFYFLFLILISIETLSPDLLDAYDAEFERISQLYEKRKPVLDAYHKWLSFWNDFVAFTVCFN
jgi:hypothetical protein